jgi:quercetin dioxygenase-like cupin family protein
MTGALESGLLAQMNNGMEITLDGVTAKIRVYGNNTGGAFSAVDISIEPGLLIPPHTHSRENELLFVAEGELGVKIGVREFTAGAGNWVVKPLGIPHALWNPGKSKSKHINIYSPAGFENTWKEISRIQRQGRFDPAEFAAIGIRAGVIPNPELIAELKTKYGLRVQLEGLMSKLRT